MLIPLKGPMLPRIAILLSATVLLAGCTSQGVPTVTQTPTTSSQSPADSGQDATDIAMPAPPKEPIIKDDHYNFLNSMATTCIYAQGVGVTETVATNGVLDGSLILLPPAEAISGSYTAGWIPANGEAAEVVFESDVFDSCAIANMESLARESGQDLRDKVRAKYDAESDTYTATVDFLGFSRTAKYQIGEGGIAYSVIGTDAKGSEIVTTMKFGMPKADQVALLKMAVDKLSANQ